MANSDFVNGFTIVYTSSGGVVIIAAAKLEDGAAGGVAGTARHAGGGTKGSQWKVTILGSLRGMSTAARYHW
jgi:hypothetical protein